MKESVLWPILQQARNHATSQSDMLGTNFDVDKFERKFAELLVAECLFVVYDPDGTDHGSEHDIVYADIESRIKEHFWG